ncbi:MAG: acetyl-CoA carboxylase subunit beta [Elusimicrobia bacterium RIFCSPLOWO2_01_FULL_54_10]|nr:MAG: acetyl-CoA carboxylase subunit beta [Elusimicrobia bacterium RIFCSPLOWO2_01_FULL_54_10]
MKTLETPVKEKPKSLWNKCPACDQIIYKKDLEENFKICPKCHHYLRMNARERIEMLADKSSGGKLEFSEIDERMISEDPLGFNDPAAAATKNKTSYAAKIISEQKKSGHFDAVVCGEAELSGIKTVLAVMDFDFMGGSMGSVVGEKITRAIERSLKTKEPLIIVSSSGGARMQEGVLSLMQMAKTSAALARHHQAGILSICVLCDPTTGGVTASYATLGDILIAEPKALVAFAGPRVIEQTIRQKLPEGFQQSEFLLQHGMVDCIVERKDLKARITHFLRVFGHKS